MNSCKKQNKTKQTTQINLPDFKTRSNSNVRRPLMYFYIFVLFSIPKTFNAAYPAVYGQFPQVIQQPLAAVAPSQREGKLLTWTISLHTKKIPKIIFENNEEPKHNKLNDKAVCLQTHENTPVHNHSYHIYNISVLP